MSRRVEITMYMQEVEKGGDPTLVCRYIYDMPDEQRSIYWRNSRLRDLPIGIWNAIRSWAVGYRLSKSVWYARTF